MTGNFWNWLLVALGGVMVIAELLLGAATGFDLAMLGISLTAGGGLGLLFASAKVGVFSSGAMALAYLVFFRKWIKSHLAHPDSPSNVDAIVGRTGVVTARIAPHAPGQVKVSDEVWRAELPAAEQGAREPGQNVKVESVNGVTLIVR